MRSRSLVSCAGVAVAIVLGAAAGPLIGAQEGPLDLPALVELALAQNAALRAVEETRGEVRGVIAEAKADAFPQLDMVSFWSRSRDPSLLNSPDFQEIIEQFPDFSPREQELYSLAVELTQSLYTGGQIGAAIELARVAEEIAETRIRTARLDTAQRVADLYYRLLAAQQALAAVEAQETARRANLETVEARLEIGEATRLEQLRAASSLAQVSPELIRRQGEIEVLRTNLRNTLGLPSGVSLEVAPRAEEVGPAPPLEVLLAAAQATRPELADLQLQLEALRLQDTVVAADGRPQVELAGRFGRISRRPENLEDSNFDEWRLALNLRWSFFDGGRRQGQRAQLASQLEQVRWQLEDLRRAVAVDVEDERIAYETARASWEAAQLAAEVAREAKRVAAESYREGLALQADVLDAQDEEARAELDRVETWAFALRAGARVARAMGLLPTAPWPRPDEVSSWPEEEDVSP